jgi:putative transcriptional regulator
VYIECKFHLTKPLFRFVARETNFCISIPGVMRFASSVRMTSSLRPVPLNRDALNRGRRCGPLKLSYTSGTARRFKSSKDDDTQELDIDEDWRAFRARLITGERQDSSSESEFCSTTWAHALPHVERGSVLLGSDDEKENIWSHCVLLILKHDAEGTIGVIINKSLGVSLRECAAELDFSNPLLASLRNCRVGFGGPLEFKSTHRSLVLLSTRDCEGITDELMPGIHVVNIEAFERSKRKLSSPRTLNADDLCVFLGYAAWQPGQLEYELKHNAWTSLASADSALIKDALFNSNEMDEVVGWRRIVSCLNR